MEKFLKKIEARGYISTLWFWWYTLRVFDSLYWAYLHDSLFY